MTDKRTRRRLWLQRVLAATILPPAILLLAEAGLRIAGYGCSPRVAIKCEVNGRKGYRSNEKFGWRFFPGYVAREFSPFVFVKDKPASTYRIFVVGCSAAWGTPEPVFSFWRMVEALLDDQYPGTRFEVIPTAMVAINSHVCREMVRECARYSPDLFVVYLGNNEVIGPYGAATVFSPLIRNLSIIRLDIRLKAARLGQLLTSLIQSRSPMKIWEGLEMFLDNPVRSDDPRMAIVYQHFQKNLEAMRDTALKSGGRIIFCTVAANLKDSPPFGSLHRPGLSQQALKQWEELFRQGKTLAEQGCIDKALECYLAAAAIDNTYAELQFCIGHCYWQKGDYEKAGQSYVMARELDVLRFRSDSIINRTIREAATDQTDNRVHLVDTEAEFSAESPHGICGSELFFEHVHMNFEGNYVLARAVCREIEKILPEHIRRSKRYDRELLSLSECRGRLVYTDWSHYTILSRILEGFIKRPPFTRQFGHAARLEEMESEIQQLKKRLTPQVLSGIAGAYRIAIAANPDDPWLRWKFAQLASQELNDGRLAGEQYRLVLERFPHFADAHASMGEVLATLGDIPGAIASNMQALRFSPHNVYALYNMGVTYLVLGKTEEAVEYFKNAIDCEPYFERAHNNLGAAYLRLDRTSEAVQAYQRGLHFVPDSEELRLNLAVGLIRLGRKKEAMEEIRTVLKADPISRRARGMLQALQADTTLNPKQAPE